MVPKVSAEGDDERRNFPTPTQKMAIPRTL